MIAFEIFVNGNKICSAGVGDDGVLHSSLTLITRERGNKQTVEGDAERLIFNVGGAVGSPHNASQHIRWPDQHLAVGDEVAIRIVETEAIDKPSEVLEPLRFECGFCGKKQDEVDRIVGGPRGHICDQCVADLLSYCENGATRAETNPERPGAESPGCSFCGKAWEEAQIAISKAGGAICIACLKIYEERLSDYAQSEIRYPATCRTRNRRQGEIE
jgi:hypothetical protein